MERKKDPGAEIPKEVQEYKAHMDKVEQAIRKMEKHIRKGKDQLELDDKAVSKLNLDPQILDSLKRSLEETNKRVKSKEVKLEQVRLSLDAPAAAPATLGEAGGGINGFFTYWWGFRLYLNDAATHELIKALGLGAAAAAAALTTAIGALPAVAIGIVLAVAAATIGILDVMGDHDGIFFAHTWNPFIPPWAWYQ